MRYDWRHILSWTEVLCFVLVWCVGIGVALIQFYGADRPDSRADVVANDADALTLQVD